MPNAKTGKYKSLQHMGLRIGAEGPEIFIVKSPIGIRDDFNRGREA